MKRKTGLQVVDDKLYGRFWLTQEKRESIPLPGVAKDDPEAIRVRCGLIADASMRLVAAGRADRARDMAIRLGTAKSQRQVDMVLRAVKTIVEKSGAIGDNITIRKFGEKWTGGDLARTFPDHVRVKVTSKDDAQILEQYVYPVMGATPVRAVQLGDAELVMAGIGAGLSRARRRHIAQAMHRLFKLAVYPAKIIEATPLPPGFLPKLGSLKAKQYLYPDEDAKLMRCRTVPVVYRLFYGLLAREGLRFGEAHALEWSSLDLDRGTVRLDENKTDDPRGWALGRDVVAALKIWKASRPGLSRPFEGISESHPAARFRNEHLRAAGVDRPELFESTDVRKPIRVHDLRATFVTIALANGKTETWVQDRTGHKSTLMIARYRRAARTVAELKLGDLLPLDQAIAWAEDLQGTCKTKGGGPMGGITNDRENKGGPSGVRTQKPRKATDFKAAGTVIGIPPGLQNKPGGDIPGPPGHALADSLQVEGVSGGIADLKQIRTEWSAFEVAAERMGATDCDGPGGTT